MEVHFQSRRLLRCYEESSRANREWGSVVGRRYIRMVNELRALPTFNDLFSIVRMRAHPFKSRPGSYALSMTGRWRLLVRQGNRPDQVIVEEVSNHYDD